ncbi:MAG: hypothetical protein MK086_10550 [Flavobacteriales bacterium]|nr:hypothetical protein [Flavobacteriales bacterium]
MNNPLRRFILLVMISSVSSLGMAQEEDDIQNTLEYQFIQLKKKSNNYQQYKVVEKIRLDNYWASVNDTLIETRTEISSLNSEVSSLKSKVGTLEMELKDRESSLEDQAYQIEHMSFLGIDMTKGGYVTFSWVIIFVLLAIALVLYMRFSSANRITKTTRSEFNQLNDEFEEHKKRTRDKETKLKRELQTEINRVEELKAKMD